MHGGTQYGPPLPPYWFALTNPGIVSIPLGFFLGRLGTVLSGAQPDAEKYKELEVRALTGARAH